MTTSSWDKARISVEFPDCSTLSDLISRIESDFTKLGEVICEIDVDGTVLTDEDENRYADNPISQIQKLTVKSNRPDDLVKIALTSALEFLGEVETASLRAAEGFRGADLRSGQESFAEAIEGCRWLIDTLIHIRGAASGINQPIIQPERWYEAEKMIAKTVTEVSHAYEARDFVLVADLMEYEITAALSVWKEALSAEELNRK